MLTFTVLLNRQFYQILWEFLIILRGLSWMFWWNINHHLLIINIIRYLTIIILIYDILADLFSLFYFICILIKFTIDSFLLIIYYMSILYIFEICMLVTPLFHWVLQRNSILFGWKVVQFHKKVVQNNVVTECIFMIWQANKRYINKSLLKYCRK